TKEIVSLSPDEEDTESSELDKTVSISSLSDTKELKDLSLIDDINKQIDTINEEENKEDVEINEEYKEENAKEENLSSKESFYKRRKVLFITGIVSLILAIIIISVLLLKKDNNDNDIVTDYLKEYETALQTYYDTEEIDDVIYVLESVKNDEAKVKKIQSKTRVIFDSWVLLYIDEEADSLDEYDEITDKYKKLLNGLHTYAIVKLDDNYITALTDYDYEELRKQIEDIYSDCIVFFDALSYYNEKDYDRAYYMFDVIDENNSYYERSKSYKNRILNNVIALLNNDINKITLGIDELTDEAKLQKYVSVEEVIISYNSVYSNLNLNDNKEYQELLNLYTSKVSEYTDLVSSNSEKENQQNEPNNDDTQQEEPENQDDNNQEQTESPSDDTVVVPNNEVRIQ
ncbi:MAG TPA: hypothetical protein IAC02_05405, partial [Candidatus Coprovivens excrementavium]|nr:hypothetical protein [Candidatus Coprovivens excrementavium]